MLQHSRFWHRGLSVCLFSALLVFAAGCGKSGTLSGKVMYKGKPLTGGMVQIFPEGKGGEFSSAIKEDGSYSVSKLPAGPAKISVFSNTTNPTANMPPMAGRGAAMQGMKKAEEMRKKAQEKAGDGGGSPSPFTGQGMAIPNKYNDPEQSGLTVQVTGGVQSFDIKLD